MMTKTITCSIRLLNKSYDIKCPKNEAEHLQQAAQQLNKQVYEKKNKFNQLDDYEALLLAALHISHELIICQTQQDYQKKQLTQFISSLENKINKATCEELITEV